jgi:hypothetical protein
MRNVLLLGTIALAACGMPLWRVPRTVHQPESMVDPPRSVAAIASVEIDHKGCLWRCPIYLFTLNAGQPARYDGICFTPLLGAYEAPLDTAAFQRVARLVLQSDFFSSDTLLRLSTNAQNVVVTVTLTDDRRWSVQVGPTQGSGLAARVDSVASLLQWRYVAPPRLPACAT